MIEAAKLPFIIYNIPQTTGYNISMSLFKKMVEKDYVIGIKTHQHQQLKSICSEETVLKDL